MVVPPVHQSASLRVRSDGPVRLAVVADTHSRPHPATAAQLAALTPDAILHAGDIGDLSVLDDLRAVAPLYAVRGNIDGRVPGLPDVITLDLVDGARIAMRLMMTHIAVYGPKLRPEVARSAVAARASLVVCGHSHVPFVARDRGVAVFNPGSIGPRRGTLPIVFGLVELTPAGLKLTHHDCETGVLWRPPAARASRAV